MVLRTYCLVCKKHTDNYGSNNVSMTNKVIRNKSRCSICLNDKSRFITKKDEMGELYFMYLMVNPTYLFFK